MGRVAAAGAVLVALVVLGAPPGAGAELSEVFQEMAKRECHFINGTEKVRFVERHIYNRVEYVRFDSDVGRFVGFTPLGERNARRLNNDPEWIENRRAQVSLILRSSVPWIPVVLLIQPLPLSRLPGVPQLRDRPSPFSPPRGFPRSPPPLSRDGLSQSRCPFPT
ncbi:H-2 class II histocompatibility antigen, I-E beta chain-like [Catharus ustulatus]|uniref:H-2 class II histocompatibility antigen, I-E beta chain-like n=1 Tax=Catharus ustulatus TaxID=91951 RepID=UPI00140AA800|nr:H-2 class II histocompatibility antigen, I-E beta chain-like [Catharus ustulatus]